MKNNISKKSYLFNFLNWEFWPSSLFYIPNLPYALYLALKAKNIVFFSVANPGIKSSGNGAESKFETLQLIPKVFRPKSVLHKKENSFQKTLENLKNETIEFPLIIKPDVGFRGLLVKKIASESELQAYLLKFNIDFIIQEFIDLPNECGIFYSRNPNNETGIISSITLKKYLSVIGDGISTLKTLIEKHPRATLYKNFLFENHQNNLELILKKDQEINLSFIGNHSKGTQFINGNHLISAKLHQTFDTINKSISGWYYGRIDLKFNDFKELEKGENFKILEINGIISEPTHMYDPEKSTYFIALKEIRNHWKRLFEIAVVNHYQHKIPYKKSRDFIKEMIELKNYTKKIKSFTN